MKKFAVVYNHWGKQHVMYLRAASFDDAEKRLKDAYNAVDIRTIDFADDFTYEEKVLRLRSAVYNGRVEQLILSIPVPFSSMFKDK